MTTTSEKKPKAKRQRRSAQDRISDLEAQIEKVRQREAARELKSEPGVQEATRVVRVLNKAIAVAGGAGDEAATDALTRARDAVAGYLEGRGLAVPQRREKRAKRKAG